MYKRNEQQDLVGYILSRQADYYRLAYSYVKNKDDALDVVQESICKAMTAKRKPQQAEEIRPWFYRIVVNTAVDFLRKHKAVKPVEEEILDQHSLTENDYSGLDLHAALDSLPVEYRGIIVLRYFEDLKIQDIATILDENINTVKTRLYTALKRLRMELDD